MQASFSQSFLALDQHTNGIIFLIQKHLEQNRPQDACRILRVFGDLSNAFVGLVQPICRIIEERPLQAPGLASNPQASNPPCPQAPFQVLIINFSE